MTITLVGTPQVGNTTNGGNVTLTFSTTPLENDYVVVYGGTGGSPAPSAPGTGYTQIALGGAASRFGVWIKKMSSSPDASVLCRGNSVTSAAVAYGCYVFRGVDGTTPQDATATTATGISTNPNPASITTVTDAAWVLAFGNGNVNDATPGTISGYSNQYNTTANDTEPITVAGATLEKATAGAENPAAWSSWADSEWYTVTVALRPAATGWTNIAKVNGIASSAISKVDDIAVASISKINEIAV